MLSSNLWLERQTGSQLIANAICKSKRIQRSPKAHACIDPVCEPNKMSLPGDLIKLQTVVGVMILVCITPILLLVAVLGKIAGKLCGWCNTPKSIVGEVAVVTGAGHGLGRAIALELAKRGCHIAAIDINLSGAEVTAQQINETKTVRAKAYKVNVVNYKELVEVNKQITADLGPVTVLINNAGILLHRNSINPEPEEVQKMIDVNLTSHFWTKMVFLPKMKQLRKGFLVTIASLAGIFPLPYNTTYTTTKAGTSQHMKALRLELALEKQTNIFVCTVYPSFLRTNDEVITLTQQINMNSLYPLISGEEAARRVVEGMLQGEREILLPGITSILYRVLGLLPVSWQDRLMIFASGSKFQTFYKVRT